MGKQKIRTEHNEYQNEVVPTLGELWLDKLQTALDTVVVGHLAGSASKAKLDFVSNWGCLSTGTKYMIGS
jgi:hypothetical protein